MLKFVNLVIWRSGLIYVLAATLLSCVEAFPTAEEIKESSEYKALETRLVELSAAAAEELKSKKVLEDELVKAKARLTEAEAELESARADLAAAQASDNTEAVTAAKQAQQKAEEALAAATREVERFSAQVPGGGLDVPKSPADTLTAHFFAAGYPSVKQLENGDIEFKAMASPTEDVPEPKLSFFYVITGAITSFSSAADLASHFDSGLGLVGDQISDITKDSVQRSVVAVSNLDTLLEGVTFYVYTVAKGADDQYTAVKRYDFVKGVKSLVKLSGFVEGYPQVEAPDVSGTEVSATYMIDMNSLTVSGDVVVFFAAYESGTAGAQVRQVTSEEVQKAVSGAEADLNAIGGVPADFKLTARMGFFNASRLQTIKMADLNVNTNYVVHATIGQIIEGDEAVVFTYSHAASFHVSTTIFPAFDSRVNIPRPFPLIEKVEETKFRIYASSEPATATVHYAVFKAAEVPKTLTSAKILAIVEKDKEIVDEKNEEIDHELVSAVIVQGSFEIIRADVRERTETDAKGLKPIVFDPADDYVPDRYTVEIPAIEAAEGEKAKLSFKEVTGIVGGTLYTVYMAITNKDGSLVNDKVVKREFKTLGASVETINTVGFTISSIETTGTKLKVKLLSDNSHGIATCVAVPTLALGYVDPVTVPPSRASMYTINNFRMLGDITSIHEERSYYVPILHKGIVGGFPSVRDLVINVAVLDSAQASLRKGSPSFVELDTGFIFEHTAAANIDSNLETHATVFCSLDNVLGASIFANPKGASAARLISGASIASTLGTPGNVTLVSGEIAKVSVSSAPVTGEGAAAGLLRDVAYCGVFAGDMEARLLPSAFVKRVAEASLYAEANLSSSVRFAASATNGGFSVIYATNAATLYPYNTRGPSFEVSVLTGNNTEAYPLEINNVNVEHDIYAKRHYATTHAGRQHDSTSGADTVAGTTLGPAQAIYNQELPDVSVLNKPVVTGFCSTLREDGSHISAYAKSSEAVGVMNAVDMDAVIRGFSFVAVTPIAMDHVPGRPKIGGVDIAYEPQAGDVRIDFQSNSELPIGCVVVDTRDLPRTGSSLQPYPIDIAKAVDGKGAASQAVSPSILNSDEITFLSDDTATRAIKLISKKEDGSVLFSDDILIAGGATAPLPASSTAGALKADSPLYRRGRVLYYPAPAEVLAGRGSFIIRTGVSASGGYGHAMVYCSVFKDVGSSPHSTDFIMAGGRNYGVFIGSAVPASLPGASSFSSPDISAAAAAVLAAHLSNGIGNLLFDQFAEISIEDGAANPAIDAAAAGTADYGDPALAIAMGRIPDKNKVTGAARVANGVGIANIRGTALDIDALDPYFSHFEPTRDNATTYLMSCITAIADFMAGGRSFDARYGSRLLYPSPYTVFSAVNDISSVSVDMRIRGGMDSIIVGTLPTVTSPDGSAGRFGSVRVVLDRAVRSSAINVDLAGNQLSDAMLMCTIGFPGSLSPVFMFSEIAIDLQN